MFAADVVEIATPELDFLVTPCNTYHRTDNNWGAKHSLTRQMDATANIHNYVVRLCSITVIYNQQCINKIC